MGILLAFAPFIAFAVIDRVVGPTMGLVAGSAVSIVLLARDLYARRAIKILEAGTAVLFVILTVYALVVRPSWSVIAVRLFVDAGLLAIVLISLAVRQPFTLQYAREQTDPALWNRPEFIATNYVITAAWALAFAVLVIVELALLYVPAMPHQLGVLAIIAVLIGAVKFTGWYPKRAREAAGQVR